MAHTHPAYGGVDNPCVDLGHGVCIREWRSGTSFFIAHDRGYPFDPAIHVGELCEGTIPVRPAGTPHPSEGASWEMTGSLEGGDLTLKPSIACRAVECMTKGSHGFVTAGKWVPAA